MPQPLACLWGAISTILKVSRSKCVLSDVRKKKARGLKHDVTDSVCVAVVVSSLLWPHHHYSASESPPTPWILKGWPTFTPRTVSINDGKRTKKKRNGRRSTLTSTSPPWRQFALRSTGNEAHRGNTTWDVLSLEKKK